MLARDKELLNNCLKKETKDWDLIEVSFHLGSSCAITKITE